MASNSGVGSGSKRIIHPVDQVLPLERLVVYGLQHVLAFYAGAVIVPLLLSAAIGLTQEQTVALISADLFTCGIASHYPSRRLLEGRCAIASHSRSHLHGGCTDDRHRQSGVEPRGGFA